MKQQILFCCVLAPDAVTLLLIGLVGGVPVTVLSIISWFIIVASSVWWGIVGWVNAHHFPPDPMIRWPFLQKTRYFSLFFGYVIFANIVARSAIPTFLLSMVFPLESVSAIGLVCFVCLAYVMYLLLYRSKTLKDRSFVCHMLILFTVISCVVGVYVSILSTGSGTHEYLQTFLPSLGAAVVGYWIKKFLEKSKRNKEKELPR